jgi:hypothetical protein
MLVFPDIEKTIVSYLKTVLTDVRVATKKHDPQDDVPPKEVIVIAAYNGPVEFPVTRYASLVLDCYADDYSDANALGLQVESVIRGCTIEGIKKVLVRLGPSRTTDPGDRERRSLDIELVVKGSEQ